MGKEVYLIGEIGQNHNGSVEIAKQIIDLAAKSVSEDLFGLKFKGMNAVKLTKRDLDYELSRKAFNEPYNSPHSFGVTYGKHRKALELNEEQHFEIYKHAKSLNLDVIETLCSPTCLSILKYFTPDRLKVASRDLNNLPLLEALAETKIPLILSTGMAGSEELEEALNLITRCHNNISVLHCVSEYPTHPAHLNLKTIPFLKTNFPNFTIGFSDHTVGISAPVAAVALGAEIIEKHITIDRKMKGTDQAGSLGKDGIRRMVRDIRLLEISLGEEAIFLEPAVLPVRKKLERSIATRRSLPEGHIISEKDIHLLSPGNGFKWKERDLVIGRKLNKDMPDNEIIYSEFLS